MRVSLPLGVFLREPGLSGWLVLGRLSDAKGPRHSRGFADEIRDEKAGLRTVRGCALQTRARTSAQQKQQVAGGTTINSVIKRRVRSDSRFAGWP